MRLKLVMSSLDKKLAIPINYQHPLSAAIYRILGSASSEYSRFLHDNGYLSEKGRAFKLFTFSCLYVPQAKVRNHFFVSNNASHCTLFVSSPLPDDFMQNFVSGLFLNTVLEFNKDEA